MSNYPTIESLKNSPVAKLNKHLFEEKPVKKSKYKNEKIKFNEHVFDSKKEFKRFIELRQLEVMGEISDLRLQVPFKLSICTYYADFVYKSKEGLIIEDSKGFRNRVYLMKKKMMLQEKGILIKET